MYIPIFLYNPIQPINTLILNPNLTLTKIIKTPNMPINNRTAFLNRIKLIFPKRIHRHFLPFPSFPMPNLIILIFLFGTEWWKWFPWFILIIIIFLIITKSILWTYLLFGRTCWWLWFSFLFYSVLYLLKFICYWFESVCAVVVAVWFLGGLGVGIYGDWQLGLVFYGVGWVIGLFVGVVSGFVGIV